MPAQAWPLQRCVLGTAVAVAISIQRPSMVEVMRPPQRPFTDFSQFWPLYVSQHSLAQTKILHAVGTSAVLLSQLPQGADKLLRFALGIGTGISLSLCAVDATAHLDTGAAEALLMVAFLVGSIRQYTGWSAKKVILLLSSGYVMPWMSHYFIENNRPATFLHPTFSLLGDLRLLGALLTRSISLDQS